MSSYTISKEQDTKAALTLKQAIQKAHAKDDWLRKSELIEQGLMHLSAGATALPDPTVSLSLLNLPSDGFAFNQEPMTQLKIGASQTFGRGDTLSLTQSKHQIAAQEQPYRRVDRRQKVALHTTLLWLDAYQASNSYELIEQTSPLLDKLGAIVSASYASSSGNTSQQDIIRAELELGRLQDRLLSAQTRQRVAMSKLSQFIGNDEAGLADQLNTHFTLPESLSLLSNAEKQQLASLKNTSPQILMEIIFEHPLVSAMEQQIRAASVDIEIAKQSYKPQYAINASYALRDDAPTQLGGNSRADFFSVGLSVSLPLFSNTRQDAQVAYSTQKTEAMRTEQRLVVRELIAALRSALDDYHGASQRLIIYEEQILPQMSQQSQATLQAYANDREGFAEVVSAKIAELDAKLTLLEIQVLQRKALAQIFYCSSINNNSINMQAVGANHE
ncbi:TolC family protein [Ningiella sp. W23]|uniref:TolC family protein n=1 Tax=Ningiella sp. W23 TaxID=3023715 RepID=UPI0039F4C850